MYCMCLCVNKHVSRDIMCFNFHNLDESKEGTLIIIQPTLITYHNQHKKEEGGRKGGLGGVVN